MTAAFRLTTPVAFIVFNRPDTTERVFAAIAAAKPPKLLVIGDGARTGRPAEAEAVAAARSVIDRVDWDCEVLTNLSPVNLGCKQRVSSGLTWVFEQVPEAIVLEDDCLPDPSFFRFCQELLERYRNDTRVGMISGANFQFGKGRVDASYYFSKYSMIWGWASWRDRWLGSYDVTLSEWPRARDGERLTAAMGGAYESAYWRKIFARMHRAEIDTWDYQWFFANFLAGRLSAVPAANLICNIGYGQNATHTTNAESLLANMPVVPMSFPLQHPVDVVSSPARDRRTFDMYFQNTKRWRRKLRAALRSIFGS
jgi:hypothetical protein